MRFTINKKLVFLVICIVVIVCCSTKCCASTIVPKRVYKVSVTGQLFIKDKESLKLERYHCGRETFWTIGYGHVIVKGENYVKITKKQAEEIFQKDMEQINASVNRILNSLPHSDKVIYSQGLVDALGSLVFNCGEAGVKRTRFYKRLVACRYDSKTKYINKQDLNYACVAIKTANISYEGHKTRRYEEYRLSISTMKKI